METVYLDTHVVVWLFYGETDKFTRPVKDLINNNEIIISPVVLLELQYLLESKKISHKSNKIVNYLSKNIGLKVLNNNFIDTIELAIKNNFTRDPFDRIIVSEALLYNSKLITKDRQILEFYENAVW